MYQETPLSLNKNQLKAIRYNKGPLLIIAGAGTGKTSVLVEKIKYIIKKNLAKPENILALTFTDKASSEMEERVDKAIPYGYFQMWISTFHAFAEKILKEEAGHIGLNHGFRLMTEAESIIFIKKNLFVFDFNYFRPLGNPNKFIYDLIKHFSRLKDEDISPENYLGWLNKIKKNRSILNEEKDKYGELAHAYLKYQSLKIKEGLMDFSDLVYYTNMLFRKRKSALNHYRQRFSYVLIDEFQDTNIAQYQLIKLLCPATKKPRLTVVGDDSQAIYKFRGASISNILGFMKDYPRAKQITLNDNYRSNQTILDTAHTLIKKNNPDTLEYRLGISKKLISHNKNDPEAVSFFLADKVEEEADWVGEQIRSLNSRYRLSELAILVRANSHAQAFIRSLTRKGIPYQFLGPGMLFKQPEVKDLIAYLKVLGNLEDSPSFFRVLSMDIFQIDHQDLSLLLSFSKKINLPLFQALEIYLGFFYPELFRKEFEIYKKYLPLLREDSRNRFLSIVRLIKKHLSLVKQESAGQILYYFLDKTGYLSKLVTFKTVKEEKVATNVSKFFGWLRTYESDHEDTSVFATIDHIEMNLELGESPLIAKTDLPEYEAVNILTVHSAKGLEFPVVFLVNLSRGRFPPYDKKEVIPIPQNLIKETLPEGDYHLQEERRLFYVGLTRAQDKLFLSSSRLYGEGKKQSKISPFILDIFGQELIDRQSKTKLEQKNQLSIFEYKQPNAPVKPATNLPDSFSYSQLQTYNTCPLQYKYYYILKIPTTPTAQESLGISIHNTLEQFYKEFSINKKIDRKRLIKIYEAEWQPIGYSSASHENKVKKEGEKMLDGFFKNHHRQNLRIINLEKFFKIKIAPDIKVVGKIDRVDRLNNSEIEVIDYKTGRQPTEKEISKNLQLGIYALACSSKGLYDKKISQITLSLFFLTNLKKISIKKTDNDIEEVKKEIIDTVARIKKDGFSPKPGLWCSFCPFKIICEAWQ